MRPIRSFNVSQWRFVAIGAAILVLLAALILLAGTVRKQMNVLVTAPHDNMQWTLAHLDVEHARLTLSIREAMLSPEEGLSELRRRFDLFYSRTDVVASMEFSKHMPENEAVFELLREVSAKTKEMSTIADLHDNELRENLPALMGALDEQYDNIRELSIAAIRWFAEAADSRRSILSDLLVEAVLVASLLAATLVLAFLFLRHSNLDARDTQTALARATTRLQSTIGASLDAVILTDKYGTLLDYNGAAQQVFGYTREEVIGQNAIEKFLDEEGRSYLADGYKQLAETSDGPLAGQGLLHMSIFKKGGDVIPIETSITSVVDGDQTIFISFVRDISERIAASESLKKSRDEAVQAAKTKSDFIAVMSHEMRTPLNGVIAAHEILAETDVSPYQAKFLNIARSSANHLLQHVNDVLDISTIDAEFHQKGAIFSPYLTLADVVESTQSIARDSGNTLEFDLTGSDADYYFGDEVQVRRILLNLLGNALKFTKNGEVRVDYGISQHDAETAILELHVSDTGSGIPEDKLGDIFNDFVRLDASYDRDTDGTGLGLSITRRMVKSLGGDIGVDSDFGVGSTFWVILPLTICEQPAAFQAVVENPNAAEMPFSRKGSRALIVEDNEINQTILRQYLRDFGFDVETASNGKMGLEKAFTTEFDFVFMDISMPVMDGIAATRALKSDSQSASHNAIVIGFTAHSSPESRSACLVAGMDHVLIKPVTRAAISLAIDCGSPQNIELSTYNGALVDLPQIEGIRTILGPRQFAQTCQRFKDELSRSYETLSQELEHADPRQMSAHFSDQIHKLAGLCASMGAMKLHKRLEVAQHLATSGDLSTLRAELSKTKPCLDATLISAAYAPPHADGLNPSSTPQEGSLN